MVRVCVAYVCVVCGELCGVCVFVCGAWCVYVCGVVHGACVLYVVCVELCGVVFVCVWSMFCVCVEYVCV